MNGPVPARRADAPEELICGCTGLTRPDLEGLLAADPGLDFERMQGATGAGLRCTACMLDLEYHFVSIDRSKLTKDGPDGPSGAAERRPLKRRLYDFIDRLSPLVPARLDNVLPVVKGPGIAQYVIVANQPMLDGGGECAPEMGVALIVRDGEGSVVHREAHTVGGGTVLRADVSRHLPDAAPGAPLAVGSVQVVRRARRSGHRGTTRPQTEVVAAAGHSAVHGQAPGGPGEGWLTGFCRPGEERLFISFVSAGDHPATIEIAYPFPVVGALDCAAATTTVALPPRGARLLEVVLPEAAAAAVGDRPMGIRWRVDGRFKAHGWCTSPGLDRLSLDHL